MAAETNKHTISMEHSPDRPKGNSASFGHFWFQMLREITLKALGRSRPCSNAPVADQLQWPTSFVFALLPLKTAGYHWHSFTGSVIPLLIHSILILCTEKYRGRTVASSFHSSFFISEERNHHLLLTRLKGCFGSILEIKIEVFHAKIEIS